MVNTLTVKTTWAPTRAHVELASSLTHTDNAKVKHILKAALVNGGKRVRSNFNNKLQNMTLCIHI